MQKTKTDKISHDIEAGYWQNKMLLDRQLNLARFPFILEGALVRAKRIFLIAFRGSAKVADKTSYIRALANLTKRTYYITTEWLKLTRFLMISDLAVAE